VPRGPPADADDGLISGVVGDLQAAGAARVKVLAREAAQAVVSRDAVESATATSQRETVLELVDESRTDDADALRELVEAEMDREGV